MILQKVTITNFLSITGSIEIDLDKKATILLGANDHGKSNILRAICCLNDDAPIHSSEVNWDATEEAKLRFEFLLSRRDVDALVDAAKSVVSTAETSNSPEQIPSDQTAWILLEGLGIISLGEEPTFTLTRSGADGSLVCRRNAAGRLSISNSRRIADHSSESSNYSRAALESFKIL